ncbi:MAG: DUF3422 domain-containing protein [Pseudomonadota bacterium]
MSQRLHKLTSHQHRERLINESFARPAQPCAAGSVVERLVMQTSDSGAETDRAHLSLLCRHASAIEPPADARHHVIKISGGHVIWERHTEFSTYTIFAPQREGKGIDFSPISLLPEEWLNAMPGALLAATRLLVVEGAPDDGAHDKAKAVLGEAQFAASSMRGGAAYVAADFRLHGDGFTRFFVIDNSGNDLVRGRLVQRLLELDMYRLAALLSLPLAQAAQPELTQYEATLASLLDAMAAPPDVSRDRDVLQRLSRAAAQIEAVGANTAYRFAASEAYYRLVLERIEQLREDRAEGRERLGVFINRRLGPAMRTCTAVANRQAAISTRIDRVTQLLATRVEVSAEEQNADLLKSMDEQTKRQLRLQETVEGLSTIAITYYGVGILLYIAKGAKDMGAPIPTPTIVGAVAAPLLLVGAYFALKVLKRRAVETIKTASDSRKDRP